MRVFDFMRTYQADFLLRPWLASFASRPPRYYSWHSLPAFAYAASDAALLRRIRAIHAAASHGTYGASRVHAELQVNSTAVACKQVARHLLVSLPDDHAAGADRSTWQ